MENEIIKLLRKKRYGLSIEDVAQAISVSRITAAKYLFVLEAKKKVDVRVIGKYRLHYPKGVLR